MAKITTTAARQAIGAVVTTNADAKVAVALRTAARNTATIIVAHLLAKGQEDALTKLLADSPDQAKALKAIIGKNREVLTIAGHGVTGTTLATDVKVHKSFNAFTKALGGVITAPDAAKARADITAWVKSKPNAFDAALGEWNRMNPAPAVKPPVKVKRADQVKALTALPFESLSLSERREILKWAKVATASKIAPVKAAA